MWSFHELLILAAFLFTCLTVFSFVNEKILKLPEEIGLMIIGLGVTFVVVVLDNTNVLGYNFEKSFQVGFFDFNDFLMNGIICFMLFSGACKIRAQDLIPDRKIIGALALASTLIAVMIYGSLVYLIFGALNISISYLECLILGAIISPTDPVSAMSILGKAGLPERLRIIIEGESLFNDGIAVAIFVTLSGIYVSGANSIAFVFAKTLIVEVAGGAGIGLLIGILFFQIFKNTQKHSIEVFSSLAAVTVAYTIAEGIGVSAPIAAVVLGFLFATLMGKKHSKITDYYIDFYRSWGVLDELLNGILYIMLGFSFVILTSSHNIILISLISIIVSLVSRYISVQPSSIFYKFNVKREIPRSKLGILLTWSGLKGGICLAMAMSLGSLVPDSVYNIIIVSTYSVVIFSTIVQGLTVKKVFNRLQKKN